MNRFLADIIQKVSAATGLDDATVERILETPPDPDLGDCAVPCFEMAKSLRKAPAGIAAGLAADLEGLGEWSRVEAKGPYLNFFFPRRDFIEDVLSRVEAAREEGVPFGMGEGAAPVRVVIDFSSPNIAKPFHIGHLRSTNIGSALYRLFSMRGCEVTGINHLGDWGTQVGKQITAYNRWGMEDSIESVGASGFNDLYVRFHREAAKDPSLEEEARSWFNRLEKREPEAVSFWEKVKSIGMDDFNAIYRRLDVHFDEFMGESIYIDMADRLLARLKESGVAVKSEGAWIVELDSFDLPPCLVQKKDGSTVYITRDLAAAEFRREKYRFDHAFYVVGAPQKLHFQQMKAVLARMGHEWTGGIEHIEFGHLRLKDRALSTRAGDVVLLGEVLDGVENLTKGIIEEKNPDLDDPVETAKKIGVGAVKYADLRVQRGKEVVFDWDKLLSFDGDTGPYVQYTHVRLSSLIAKYGKPVRKGGDYSRLTLNEEYRLVKLIDQFPGKVEFAAASREPSMLAGLLWQICKTFNGYYNAHRILTADEDLTAERMQLVSALREVVATILVILGLAPIERM